MCRTTLFPLALVSDLDVIGDVLSEGHMQHNQRLSWHGGVGEGVTPSVWAHSALKVRPIPYRMHRLIPDRKAQSDLTISHFGFKNPGSKIL